MTDSFPTPQGLLVRYTQTASGWSVTSTLSKLRLQKQLRDELAKCSAAVFMVDDITALENVQSKVHSIHSELLLTSSTKHADDRELPILKNLMKEEVAEYQRKAKVIARANQLTHRYKKLKRKSNRECPIPPKHCSYTWAPARDHQTWKHHGNLLCQLVL